MEREYLVRLAGRLFSQLCVDIPTRPVGRAGNREATSLFASRLVDCGFAVDCPSFQSIDWASEGAVLCAGSDSFEVYSSPYSLGCDVRARLTSVSSLVELERTRIDGSVVLVKGELARGQLMPKNFPWYNPEEHQRIISLLEASAPAGIVCATSRDPEMVGSQYPFPLIEDGDFDIPSVYMTVEEGARLQTLVGKEVSLVSRARRIPSSGCNVVARKGTERDGCVVLTAHIDTRDGTPGALDDTSGVVTLLLLGELLRDYHEGPAVEIVALNGEDYYASSGEKLFLETNRARMDRIILNINIDDVGYHEGRTAWSLYECPEKLAGIIRRCLERHEGFFEGPSWQQGDHMIFVQSGRPALAFTSELFMQVLAEVTHSEKDRPDLVDLEKIADLAIALRQLLPQLERGE